MQGVLLSINALYNYDETIFDDLVLPRPEDIDSKAEIIADPEPLDKDLLIANILSELGELSLIYSDPATVKTMIRIWSAINKRPWLQLWETLLYSYNPIWNKDGTYRETRSLQKSGQESGSLTDAGTSGRTVVTDQDTSSQSSGSTTGSESGTANKTTAHNVTGFDTNQYSPDTQDVENGSTSGQSSEQTIGSVTGTNDITVTENGTSGLTRTTGGTSSGTEAETLERVEQGNIGVTTTQQMIREQREIVQFNMYHYITESFKERFCVMVY